MATRNNASADTIRVEVGTIGGELKTIVLNGDRSVSAALEAAGYDGSMEVRIGGESFSPTDNVEDGDTLIVLNQEKVKGA